MKTKEKIQPILKSIGLLPLLNPITIVRSLYQNRELIWNLTKREINSTYRGSFLGALWTIIIPLMMMLIYTFVFSVILQATWDTGSSQPTPRAEFALILYSGLTAFNVFASVINRAPGLVLSVPNYVKKVVFPLEILPIVILGSAMFTCMINVILILIGSLFVYGRISPTFWLLPLVLIPFILLSLGLGWFLSSMGVYVRDIGQATSVVVQILFFMTPIVYPISMVPPNLRFLIALNPLTPIVEGFRRVLLWGEMLDWKIWTLLTLFSFILFILGSAWFYATKRGFADVM
jgi:lipopolysaccharide transport system permease protein